jgi:predicted restriction endonuclease
MAPAFEENQAPFETVRPRRQETISRLLRSINERDATRAAYANRCIVDGLTLEAPAGRPGTQWSHWRPIAVGGPDTIVNTSMVSPTVHQLIETGLLGLDENYRFRARGDAVTYLIRNSPTRRPILPADRSVWPSQTFLQWHRQRHGLDELGEVVGA